MAVFLAQNLAPFMFAALVAFLLLGYPVAFSLGAVGLIFFVVGVELAPYSDGIITLSWPLLNSMPGRIYEVMRNDTLLAIPFFTFMGLILERSGMAEDLLETIGQLFGTIRGGLAYAVIFVGAMLAATTGVVAASVISMGLISLPIMLRYGYDRRLAAGTIAASGTLAQIIPPSLVLIVLADQLGRSVDQMYKGALLPGIMLAALYALYVFIVCRINPAAGPGLPLNEIAHRKPDGSRGLPSLGRLSPLLGARSAQRFFGTPATRQWSFSSSRLPPRLSWHSLSPWSNKLLLRQTGRSVLSPLAERVTFVMVPPLMLIFLVLGTILIGVATPTEGGAMGAVGALLLAAINRYSEQCAAALQLADRSPSDRSDGQALRLCHVHPHRRANFFAHLLRRERPHLGRASSNLTPWRHVRLPHRGHDPRFLARLLSRLLRAGVHPRAPPEAGRRNDFPHLSRSRSHREGHGLCRHHQRKIQAALIVEAVADISPFMVWFGILLAVNMQTSFMHPPFGFALFYLRSVAPKEPYTDKVTGKITQPVLTSQIYWGAVPYVGIQLLMVDDRHGSTVARYARTRETSPGTRAIRHQSEDPYRRRSVCRGRPMAASPCRRRHPSSRAPRRIITPAPALRPSTCAPCRASTAIRPAPHSGVGWRN